MVNELKRRQMIWLIKRASSLTAWKRFEESFIKFVEEFEVELKRSPNPRVGSYKRILDAQIDLEQGLEKLAQGDKSVFQYRNEFDGYIPDLIGAFGRIFDTNPDQEMDVSNFDELYRLWDEMEYPKFLFIEDRRSNEGVEHAYAGFWVLDEPDRFGPFNFPKNLPTPSEPENDTLIQSHEPVPEYGLWEPVKVLSGPLVAPEHQARLDEWMTKLGYPPSDVPVKYKADIIGCPSYLLQGTPAPTVKLEDGEGYRGDTPQPVTWRLLWKDDRYINGTIPEEEKLYFAEPDAAPTPGRLRGLPGDIVPRTGWWHSPAQPNEQRDHYFTAGQYFPDIHTTEWGHVIWDYDPDLQKDAPKK